MDVEDRSALRNTKVREATPPRTDAGLAELLMTGGLMHAGRLFSVNQY
jgi:hypothetical protein